MIKKLLNNWGLKLGSIVMAAILWILVTNINDPLNTIRFSNIPVNLRNMNKITDAGKVYEILDNSDIVSTVTVIAPRSVVDSLSRDNIIATADFEDYTTVDGQYRLSINFSTNKYYQQVNSISGSTDTVRLTVENRISRTLRLTATTSGSVTDGYIIGDVTTEQNQIRISGPASRVDQVVSASANVEVTGYTSNIGTVAEIRLYDADGNEVDKSDIQMSMNSVGVNVTILATKRVPVNLMVSGTPADGYLQAGDVAANPDTVLLAGRSSVLEEIDAVTVQDASLDLTGLTQDLSATVDISSNLPAGTIFGDRDYNGIVTATVPIQPVASRNMTLYYRQIRIDNVPEGYTAEILTGGEDNRLTLRIEGLESVISGVSASDVQATVDLGNAIGSATEEETLSGNYRCVVNFSLPEGVSTNDNIRIQVSLREEQ
ncbi:MAG: hypothetical protein IJT34_03240 [Butyrivibrio sp.]|nr:hypothetical protein [Butyrivibrio sp.]